MIYTVISAANKNEIEQNGDCRIIRQPLILFTDSVAEYVENTKNEPLRAERKLAYATLLCSLKAFFGIKAPTLLRTESGKPYLKGVNVFISISHSGGAAAICLSDEGEVGVDIQSEPEPDRQKRLESRFFTDYEPKSERIPSEFYFCSLSGDEAIFESIAPEPSDTDGFGAKWSAAESLMKLHGGGFGDVTSLPRLAEESKTDIRNINLNKKYYVAISVKEN